MSALITTMTPQWQVSSRVTAFSTTRLGGVSAAPFDSLNLGLHVGDELEAVQENRRRLRDAFALPGEPCWLNQTHSADMVSIGSKSEDASLDGAVRETLCADGSWTNKPDTVLAVLTADCLPVVISDAHGTQLAVVHAGWRGLAAGILDNAVAKFDAGSELHAWLGPAIGPDTFEVGEEVRQAFVERNAEHAESFLPGMPGSAHSPDSGEKFWADIYALARRELQLSREVIVTGGDYCTVSQPHWFHSHRRDGVSSGRMATVAWIGTSSD